MLLRSTFKLNFSTASEFNKKAVKRIPKEVEIDVSPGCMSMVFESTKKSPSYLLLKELFRYLMTNPILQKQFPLIKSDERFKENWMTLHLQILKNRLMQEKQKNEEVKQVQLYKFDYNAQKYFFGDYAAHLYKKSFWSSMAKFQRLYLEKLQVFEEELDIAQQKASNNDQILKKISKLVFQNKIGEKESELLKLSRYYKAQSRYLSLLTWQDLLYSKVQWGIDDQPWSGNNNVLLI